MDDEEPTDNDLDLIEAEEIELDLDPDWHVYTPDDKEVQDWVHNYFFGGPESSYSTDW